MKLSFKKFLKKLSEEKLLFGFMIIAVFIFFNFYKFTEKHTENTHVLAASSQIIGNPVCISSHINGLSQSDLDKQTTLMTKAGINWVRFDVNWSDIEQTKGIYNWTHYDSVVNAVLSKGMHVLALVAQYGVPSWERTDPSNWQSPPNNPQDFQTFIQALATHFKGKVTLYEIGNEQNILDFWPPAPDAKKYTQFLIAGYNGVKAADSTAQVVSAGLANIPESEDTNFINAMYANGAKDHFDYLGFHPYSWPAGPDFTQWPARFNYLDTVHQIMTANGDGDKKILITEVGWPSTTQSNGVTEATQADYITRLFQKIENENYQYVSLACIYDFIDDGTNKNNPENNFGMLRTDYSQKPAFAALQKISNSYNANTTLTPAVSVTHPSTSSATPSDAGTTISFVLCPHVLGDCGDAVNPQGGNISPKHANQSIIVTIYSSDNKEIASIKGSAAYDSILKNFHAMIPISNISAGQYLVSVKLNGFLSKQFPGIISINPGQKISLPAISLTAGDVNNDNQLDILDYNLIISCFGTKQSYPSCNSSPTTTNLGGDINDDGVIDAVDYNVFLRELSVQKGS